MKKVVSILFLLFFSMMTFAQESPLTARYLLEPMTVTPAYAGSGSGFRSSMFHYNKWVGVEGSPVTNMISMDMPVDRDKIGLGLLFYNDKIGVTHENDIKINYAYRIGMKRGVLSLGLGLSVNFLRSSWSDLVTVDPGDDLYLVDSRLFVSPNVGFGAMYIADRFYMGFSIPQFLSTEYNYTDDKQILKNRGVEHYNYLVNTGVKFNLSKRWSMKPSVMMSYCKMPGFDIYAALNVDYYDRVSLTVTYCSYNVLGAILQVGITNRFSMGYSYELDLNNIGRYNNGSHAFVLKYVLRNKVNVYNPLDF